MRSVVHEPLFADGLAELISDPEVADEYLAAAESVLAETPHLGTQIKGDIWIMPLAPIDDRAVAIYYTFDENMVWLVAISAW